jgi:antitoxin component YwqK of YwqJK toxin-antitoxin module
VYYSPGGDIVGVGNFDKGNGIQKAWWPNGNLKREISYKNNLKNGTEKWYDEEGKLEKVLYFEDGREVRKP